MVERSGGSLAARLGAGFRMRDMMEAANKVAGLDRSTVKYAEGYPDENVWHLLKMLLEYQQAKSLDELYVVFISNAPKKIELWCQRGAVLDDAASGYTSKEFHCIVLQTPVDGFDSCATLPSYVWDPSAELPFPCRLGYYACNVLRTKAILQQDDRLSRYYRVVPAARFLEEFASDRSHMRLIDEDAWLSPPPSWPKIVNKKGQPTTITKYWDLYPPTTNYKLQDQDSMYGVVMDEMQFLQHHNVTQ